MNESKTPRTDAAMQSWYDETGEYFNGVNLDFARSLELEIGELHSQLRSHIELLQTLVVKFDDYADGAPDATDLGKFCNEMVGLYNGILLKETWTLWQERDQLKKHYAQHNN